MSSYLNILIDGQKLDLYSAEDLPISISYRRENAQNFQSKTSSQSFNITTPATVANDKIANCFHNSGIEDLTQGEILKGHRNALIEADGYELLVGKSFLINARHGSCPISYEWNFYGNNGDWIIPLKESTLYDFLQHINFTFTKEAITSTWEYDGTDENLPYVFAPVRYSQPLDDETHIEVVDGVDTEVVDAIDYSMNPVYMRPSLSVYWLLYWGFKSIGYRIESQFFNTDFFRRLTMPWTWGNFLYSEGTRLDNLDFLAKSSQEGTLLNQSYTGFFNAHVDNIANDGAFDNNGSYSWDESDGYAMKWTYLNTFDYGKLEATFHLSIYIDAIATANSDVELYVRWYKNGVQQGNQEEIVYLNAPTIGRRTMMDLVDKYKSIEVEPGDVIACKLFADNFDSDLGRARLRAKVEAFELDYFRIPLGGDIDFSGFNAFKNYKFLDFLSGVLDTFNISPATDPISRVVLLEPEHPYSLNANMGVLNTGFLTGNFLDWQQKQDLSKESTISLFSDSERELEFVFKDDPNDGLLKKLQDRNATVLGRGKYVLPDRFKTGKSQVSNRFFSPVVHADMKQWSGLIDGYEDRCPQVVALIPENISNTSRSEAQNSFAPKLCYYKGFDNTVGWVFDKEVYTAFPFMFAVNYMNPSADDPCLSYSDELIDEANGTIAKGLLRRFYLQRMAIMRHGIMYETHFRLKNFDVQKGFQREHIICRGQKWELVEINNFKPTKKSESSTVLLRKHYPTTETDNASVFPSQDSVVNSPLTNPLDIKYSPLKCLPSDIPKKPTI